MTRWRVVLLVLLVVLPLGAAQETTCQDLCRFGVTQLYLRHADEAVGALQKAIELEPGDPRAHYLLSRAYQQAGRDDAAFAESQMSVRHRSECRGEEWYLINAWGWRMWALHHPQEADKSMEQARHNADYGLCRYPESVDLYLLRGDLESAPVHAAPYYLAALALQPDHPFGQAWHLTIPAAPSVVPRLIKPIPGLAAARRDRRLYPGLGRAHLGITTRVPRAQAFFDQGLNLYYTYQPLEARVSFRQAARLDPTCGMAWWGVSLCGQNTLLTPLEAATLAWRLVQRHGTPMEKRYCAIRLLQLQGASREEVLAALDGAIAADPRNVTTWMWRAGLDGFVGLSTDSDLACRQTPWLLAAWHLAPDHPGANQELEHACIALHCPQLGWRYAKRWAQASPNMPHAQFMAARLAMDLGRWPVAMSWAERSMADDRAGFPAFNPAQDRSLYTWALLHAGRFREARAAAAADVDLALVRLYRLQASPTALAVYASHHAETAEGWYAGALSDIQRHQFLLAQDLESRLRGPEEAAMWADEIDARLEFSHGSRERGLEHLGRLARQSDAEAPEYPWGQAAYMDGLWGQAALRMHHLDIARQAFQRGLSQDPADVLSMLGLQVVAERRHDAVEASRYADRVRHIWSHSDPGAASRLLAHLRTVAVGREEPF